MGDYLRAPEAFQGFRCSMEQEVSGVFLNWAHLRNREAPISRIATRLICVVFPAMEPCMEFSRTIRPTREAGISRHHEGTTSASSNPSYISEIYTNEMGSRVLASIGPPLWREVLAYRKSNLEKLQLWKNIRPTAVRDTGVSQLRTAPWNVLNLTTLWYCGG